MEVEELGVDSEEDSHSLLQRGTLSETAKDGSLNVQVKSWTALKSIESTVDIDYLAFDVSGVGSGQTAPLTQRPDIGQESEEENGPRVCLLVHFPKGKQKQNPKANHQSREKRKAFLHMPPQVLRAGFEKMPV
ncbi:hypothetical protein MG293_019791 [Ovis ammon polii]|uniref:Uncharacterized protein n=1 Tax=Ovis ammon polii TaxID=230172 RepID=A0AAD4TPD4_OVIAM|nr:hypothetical protein MG293_019791 [Ovis ammon polii]